jgi:predicted NUDIX family phosphoesterase
MNKPPCWAVPVTEIPHYGESQFTTGAKADEILAALEKKGNWEARNQALEDNTALRQVIPYVLIKNTTTNKLMVLERMKSQEEARLHGNICLGAGGHMEPIDWNGAGLIEAAARREITEETGFEITKLKFVGILCVTDPAEPTVHHVHIGAVYLAETTQETFGGELDKQNPKWMHNDELFPLYPRMETWAKIVASGYLGVLAP